MVGVAHTHVVASIIRRRLRWMRVVAEVFVADHSRSCRAVVQGLGGPPLPRVSLGLGPARLPGSVHRPLFVGSSIGNYFTDRVHVNARAHIYCPTLMGTDKARRPAGFIVVFF